MPLGIVSDEEFESERRKLDSSIHDSSLSDEKKSNLTITEIETGRGNTKEVPSVVREIIAEAKLSGESNKEIQKHFPVSSSSISAYQHGVTSTAAYNKPKNERLQKVRNNVSKRAGNRLLEALDALGNKDLNVESAKDVSSIAKDMAAVFEKITPEIKEEKEKTFHLHIHAPKQKSVDDYEVIDI